MASKPKSRRSATISISHTRTCGTSCTLRAVQHIKILSSAEVFTSSAGVKVLFQTKKARREVDLHDSVGLSGERQHGGYHAYDGIHGPSTGVGSKIVICGGAGNVTAVLKPSSSSARWRMTQQGTMPCRRGWSHKAIRGSTTKALPFSSHATFCVSRIRQGRSPNFCLKSLLGGCR